MACCVLLLKTRFSKFKAKPQTFGCFEGCTAADRYVLAVLPTGYGKNLTDLRAVAAKHVGNRNVSIFVLNITMKTGMFTLFTG